VTQGRRLLFWLLVVATNFHGESVPVIQKVVTEVDVNLVATDSRGRFVPGLTAEDVKVIDQGLPVPYFAMRQSTGLPLQLGIVLDLSESTRRNWTQSQTAINEFIRNLARPEDEIFLVAFDDHVRLEKSLLPEKGLEFSLPLPSQGGQTALYDAICHASQKKLFELPTGTRRSALLVFSDGVDNTSWHSQDDAVRSAQARSISIYTITSRRPRQDQSGDEVLRQLACSTGGQDFVVNRDGEMRNVLSLVDDELRNYYLLYFHPSGQGGTNGEFRRLRLIPVRNDSLSFRYRAGYFVHGMQKAEP